MVGEIEDDHSFMATYNQSIHIPDVDDPAMTDEKHVGNGKIRRAEWGPEKRGEEAKSVNSRCRSDRTSNSNGGMIVLAEINMQKEQNKEEKGPTVDISTAFKQEANVSVLSDGNAHEIMSKESVKPESTSQAAADRVERSPSCVRAANEGVIPQGNFTKFTEMNKQTRKMNLSVHTEGNVFINPAGVPSQIHPTYTSERSERIRENSFKSKLGMIIPEENEKKDWGESPMSHVKGDEKSLGHLARVRAWMCVRLTNKQKTEAVLKRK